MPWTYRQDTLLLNDMLRQYTCAHACTKGANTAQELAGGPPALWQNALTSAEQHVYAPALHGASYYYYY
jgi:hypothetical protein